ncbi:predicted protein [Naegleria gruberi]|uniref:Predicted protein n=1 Tax=Naegleria gruberi TaxID=5762 RepID=D2UZJ7_NAEGR|nr:uncharacterized protein NAEGRDRAFT_61963 [Naegleria gruberi]EFC50166.1 predicted protein [Naegleria gruberi]|eukprot:XP_002682910.1 predicted protein [Naegleria gruberi strain NEG-M]
MIIKKRTNKASTENQRAEKKKKIEDGNEEGTMNQVLEEIATNHAQEVEVELNNLKPTNSGKNEKSNNSILAVSTKQNKKAQLGIHQTIINANREEKQDETYMDRITSTNVNEFDDLDNKKKKDLGPTKVSKSVRVTSRMDYQPDICKDYYETGFCGYGDNCKFAHVREQHVSSIEHSKKWEQEQKKKLEAQSTKDMRAEGEEQVPHACFICKKTFNDPVVTICGHYFCSKCALEKYNAGKNPNCQCCGNNTKGVFNTAHKLKKKN